MTEQEFSFQLLPAGHNIKKNKLKLYGVPKHTFVITSVSELYSLTLYSTAVSNGM